jgi:hypothetical protein
MQLFIQTGRNHSLSHILSLTYEIIYACSSMSLSHIIDVNLYVEINQTLIN